MAIALDAGASPAATPRALSSTAAATATQNPIWKSTGDASGRLLTIFSSSLSSCTANTIPNDPASPFVTSGIRLGTAAVTSRGMNEADMDRSAEAIALVIKNPGDEAKKAEAYAIVKGLTDKYPLYE